jgi:hypothetical protein
MICAVSAHEIARGQNLKWPALAFMFTLAQPLLFLHSFSELTELPFAALIGLAFLCYQKKSWMLMALLVGLSPLSRPEGFGFVMLAALALVLHREYIAALLLPLPLIMWNHLGWMMWNNPAEPWWRWLIDNWPYAAQSLYDRGTPVHFILFMPMIVSPFIFPATVAGIWDFLRSAWSNLFADHIARCRVLIAALPLMVLVVHSFLYWRGLMASNGEPRYMLTVAVFWAVLSAAGWEWFFERFRWPHILRWAGVAAIAPILVQFYYPVIPLVLNDDWVQAGQIAQWYETSGIKNQYPFICASHPAVFYALDLSSSNHKVVVEFTKADIAKVPMGTLMIWDPVYGVYNSDSNRSIGDKYPEHTRELLSGEGWHILDHSKLPAGLSDNWIVCVSTPAPPGTTSREPPGSP